MRKSSTKTEDSPRPSSVELQNINKCLEQEATVNGTGKEHFGDQKTIVKKVWCQNNFFLNK